MYYITDKNINYQSPLIFHTVYLLDRLTFTVQNDVCTEPDYSAEELDWCYNILTSLILIHRPNE